MHRQDQETCCIADILGPQRCGMEVGTGLGNQSEWGLVLQLTAWQQHTTACRAYIVCAVDDVLVHLNNQSYQLIHGAVCRRLTICKLQLFCAMQHYGWNGTLTNLLPTVLVPVRSIKCRVYRGLKWLSSGRSRSGKISSRYFATGRKNNNMAGRSGIGMLVTGFSRVGH